MERKRQQCPRCKSYNLKFGLLSNECKDCGLKQYLTLWNEGTQYTEQKTFKPLLNKVLIGVGILLSIIYLALPLIVLRDAMAYLRSGNFTTFIIGIILVYVVHMMINGKYKLNIRLPNQQPTRQPRQPRQPPQSLQFKTCNICGEDKLPNQVHPYKYKNKILNICDDCLEN